jgi:hypothetical protein
MHPHPIAYLIASTVSTTTDRDDLVRAQQTASRAIARLPDEDTALMPGICDAYNMSYLASEAMISRRDGYIDHALRCEATVDRLLSGFGL